MAAVTPTSANKCVGSDSTGAAIYQLYCNKGTADNPVFVCATWRKFKVQCPKVNQLCSNLSEAWVPAITVCNQRLF